MNFFENIVGGFLGIMLLLVAFILADNVYKVMAWIYENWNELVNLF